MGSTEVNILGQKYTIKGDASEEHIKKLAMFVDTRMKEVYNASPGIAPLKAAILASLDIADELYRTREEHNAIAKNIEERADVLTGLFD
ncbi:MAG: cell division protein ZapA [Nitrospirae bacterium]|nr:cell division protein ZapA [Nitrospirota bacterium]